MVLYHNTMNCLYNLQNTAIFIGATINCPQTGYRSVASLSVINIIYKDVF